VPKRVTARLFYVLLDRVTEIRIPAGAGDFRLMDRRVVDALLSLPERNRYMKGLYAWVGFHQIGIEYTRVRRVAGKSGWSYLQLSNFAIDALTSFPALRFELPVWAALLFRSLLSSMQGSWSVEPCSSGRTFRATPP
jgi:hypothetical protein